MPPSINIPGSGHTGPVFVSGLSLHYLPYTDSHLLSMLRGAINLLSSRIVRYSPCNKAFAALPGRRTLLSIWHDPRIWINFDSSRTGQDFGETTGFDITITHYALAMGHWTTAATLVHELAHVDGAPDNDQQAERTLIRCLLPGPYDPTIIGRITLASRTRVA